MLSNQLVKLRRLSSRFALLKWYWGSNYSDGILHTAVWFPHQECVHTRFLFLLLFWAQKPERLKRDCLQRRLSSNWNVLKWVLLWVRFGAHEIGGKVWNVRLCLWLVCRFFFSQWLLWISWWCDLSAFWKPNLL